MTQKQLDNRMAMERKVVRKLIRTAHAAGWSIPYVNDGEEKVRCITEKDVMDAVFSVDESWIGFSKQNLDGINSLRATAYIVLGNDGWDCIADNSIGALFVDEVMAPMDTYTDKLAEVAA